MELRPRLQGSEIGTNIFTNAVSVQLREFFKRPINTFGRFLGAACDVSMAVTAGGQLKTRSAKLCIAIWRSASNSPTSIKVDKHRSALWTAQGQNIVLNVEPCRSDLQWQSTAYVRAYEGKGELNDEARWRRPKQASGGETLIADTR